MKKTLVLPMLCIGLVLSSCGGGEEGEKESACKTGNGIEISCDDADNYKKVSKIAKGFDLTFPQNKEEYEAFINTNEAVLKEIEPLWPSIEEIVEADAGLKEQQPYTKVVDYKADIEKYKSVLADLGNISVSGAQEDGTLMLTIKNGSSKAITKVRGNLQYLDAEGNLLCEKEHEFRSNSMDMENGFPAGGESKTDKGIYCKDKDKVASVNFVVVGLDYYEEE